MKKFSSFFLSMIIMMMGVSFDSIAQKKERTRLKAEYSKQADGYRQIDLLLTQGRGKSTSGVPNSPIKISMVNGEDSENLGSILTNEDGEAQFKIEPEFDIPTNEDGYAEFNFRYAGNDSLSSSKKGVEFMDLNIELTFATIDSVNILTLYAYKLDSVGTKVPVNELDAKVGVKRLHSTLFLDELSTEDDGKAEFEFPNDIPGDSVGKLMVQALVFEDDDFGTVHVQSDVNWGTIVDYSIKGNGRSLFGDEAPLWMIIGVVVVLGGAWYHFFLAVSKVIKMRKLGKLENIET